MLYILTAVLAALFLYGLARGKGLRELCTWAMSGVLTAKNIAIVMLLVGALTALWRACGTIAFIVSLASGALSPALFLPATFVLCAAISVLTGTSIGTAATMGVICMSVGEAMNAGAASGTASSWFSALCGGAILSGAYFGDRCSPVSTSALLVSEITHTNLYDNIRGMIKTGWIPTVVSLAAYAAFGFFAGNSSGIAGESPQDMAELFGRYFDLRWYLALPAISILALALFRIDVKINMLVSIALSAILYLCCSPEEGSLAHQISNLAVILFSGFNAPDEISAMLSGGGIFSMVKLILVVLISLTFAGLFRGLGILPKLHKAIARLSRKVSPLGCTLLTSIFTSALACNQTLAIVLTNEICTGILPNEKQRALALENTAVIIAPLIPWTVASLVPLGTIGASVTSILFAFFLILTPVMQLIASGFFKNRVQ